LVNPVTVHDVAGEVTVQVWPPWPESVESTAVTVYEVGGPPVVGAVMVTVAWALPDTAVGAPGVPGGTSGTTAFEAADAPEVPPPLVAVEVKV
jgi:hypothetical protein